MSAVTHCNRFVENAWKKELCSNCFKPREEHSESGENIIARGLINTTMTTTTTTTTTIMNSRIGISRNTESPPQGILKGKSTSSSSSSSSRIRKKAVGFPEALTEVIGYGGDDFSDSEEFEMSESFGVEDDIPDGEEERALSNLTRANTNFNTITANLSSNGSSDSKKSAFASLMLGKPRKDSDGKKKTLLVSVTPFGGDGTGVLPSARRPSERKGNSVVAIANFVSGKSSQVVAAINDAKSEVTLKAVNSIPEEKITRDRNEKEIAPTTTTTTEVVATVPHKREDNEKITQASSSSRDEKILVDMPLITSSNLISVIQNSDSLVSESSSKTLTTTMTTTTTGSGVESQRKIGITRNPGVKKQKDVEKPKICSLGIVEGNYKHSLNTKNEYIARSANNASNGSYNRIEEREFENRVDSPRTRGRLVGVKGKEVNTLTVEAPTVEQEEDEEETGKFGPRVSRELAGEPDGKADEEMVIEPPELPRSPPPPLETARIGTKQSEPRNSFLHNAVAEKKCKPGIPHKPSGLRNPATIVRGRNMNLNLNLNLNSCLEKSNESATIPTKEEEDTMEEDKTADGAELVRSPNKRRMAPKPPPPTYAVASSSSSQQQNVEDGVGIFARNPGAAILKSDSPVVREKEKRERASSCSPKFRKDADEPAVEETVLTIFQTTVPEPAPRRLISLSQDSLSTADKSDEKKKARSRFSLKKFLRMGSKKDQVDAGNNGIATRNEEISGVSPQNQGPSKPRIEIIHPLELDGAAVEVVVSREKLPRLSNDEAVVNDSASKNDINQPTTENQRPSSSLSINNPGHHPFARPGKPPPPPRNQSLDDWARLDPANKPARPPPPRTEIKSPSKSWHPSSPTSPTSPDLIYANLAAEDVPGEVRSALAPSKPQRTASMRDHAVSQPPVKKRPAALPSNGQDYEVVDGPRSPVAESPNMSNENCHPAYECLSSSPECDSSLDLRHGTAARDGVAFQPSGKRKSDSSALEASNDFKYHHQPFARSTSLPYCGSETESELYSPYSFYTGDEGPEEDQDWKNKEHESRVGRIRQRRGRSIVHRSLEDNYGAVVVANHEALAQVLEQLNQSSGIPAALRGLKTASLRLSDFALEPNTSLPIGRRVFYSGTWNDVAVTICVALDLALHVTRKEFNLVPIVEFTDTIPKFVAEKISCPGKDRQEGGVEATISVLPHLQISTIGSFISTLKDPGEEGLAREASFVLLQLVNAFKNLQARGIEEAPKNLSNAILCREDKDACYRLYILQSLSSEAGNERDQENVSLCQCVLKALRELRLSQRLPLIEDLLERERTATLSQVKSVLEFSLWGPADVTLGAPRDREMTLQRWLDLERATVLHALVRARAPLAVTDEYHLLFLVRTSAKIMCEASILLDAQRRK